MPTIDRFHEIFVFLQGKILRFPHCALSKKQNQRIQLTMTLKSFDNCVQLQLLLIHGQFGNFNQKTALFM